jgi:hypothetical protein
VAANSKGVTSIVRNSAGNYTLTLMDAYTRFMFLDAIFLKAATGIPASPNVGIVTAANNASGQMVINFVCSTGGAATDPANGEEMFLGISLSNSSAS